jgi:hypothetical protein
VYHTEKRKELTVNLPTSNKFEQVLDKTKKKEKKELVADAGLDGDDRHVDEVLNSINEKYDQAAAPPPPLMPARKDF